MADDAWHDSEYVAAADYDALLAEVERLREALTEAIQEVEFWAGYAPEYFREKHDYKGSIAKLRAAIDAARGGEG